MNSIQEALKWRYAVKKMSGEPADDKYVEEIIHAAHYAPTSSGLMPFKIFLITNQDLKAQIRPVANNQSQITDSSHLLVFASWDSFTDERIAAAFSHMNAERGIPESATKDYVQNLQSMYGQMSVEEQQSAAGKQSYISLGFALLTAAQLGVDTTPMEGFDRDKLDELLNLKAMGLKSQTMLAIGRRDPENDWLYPLKKVRPSRSEFIIEMK